MPLPSGTRYRVKSYPGGKKVRLAFNKKGKVIEAKSMKDVLAANIRNRKSKSKSKSSKKY